MAKRRRYLMFGFLVLAFALGPKSGLSFQDSYKVKLDVNLVTVDTLVRTGRGDFVGGLEESNFILLDNGIPQKISLFASDRIPLAVALVIQNSIGISNHFSELKRAAFSALSHMRPEDQAVLYSFAECPTRHTELTSNWDQVAQKISDLGIGAAGDEYNAIYAAARYLRAKAPDRRRAIIIVSGSQVYSFPRDFAIYNYVDETDVMPELLNGSITLHYVKSRCSPFCFGADENAIDRLADATGGMVANLKNPRDFEAALTAAITGLRNAYTLGFTPLDSGKPASYHQIAVKLKNVGSLSGYRVQARRGYYWQAMPDSWRDYGFRPDGAGVDFCEKSFLYDRIEEVMRNDAHAVPVKITNNGRRGGNSELVLNVEIDPANIKFVSSASRHSFKILIAVFAVDSNTGKLNELYCKASQDILSKEQHRKLMQTKISYSIGVRPMPPGSLVRIIVYDFAAKKGAQSAFQF